MARKSGASDGIRTRDGRNHNPGLYQLSYARHRGPTKLYRKVVLPAPLVRPEGLEPPTGGLEIRCSIQLSYGRKRAGEMVGAEGFEPPTLCSQSRCATRLRHAPTRGHRTKAFWCRQFQRCQAAADLLTKP